MPRPLTGAVHPIHACPTSAGGPPQAALELAAAGIAHLAIVVNFPSSSTSPWEAHVIRIDKDGHPVGIDIDQASKHLDLRTLDLRRIPSRVEKVAG